MRDDLPQEIRLYRFFTSIFKALGILAAQGEAYRAVYVLLWDIYPSH